MKIISGKYKGIKIDYQITGTRPTMDRVKESFMAMIQKYVKNSTCLDLFAGSGSIGLELLSNGAKICYFADSNKQAIDTINKNIKKLKVDEEYHLMTGDFRDNLKLLSKHKQKFDIIFLDPPYQGNFLKESLDLILTYDLIGQNGLIICEYELEEPNISLEIWKEKTYGSKTIRIYINR